MKRHRLLLFTIAFLYAASAAGFTGEEHRRVSRRALQLALASCAASGDCSPDEMARQQIAPLLDCATANRFDYGRLVSSIDYRVDPLQLLERAGDKVDLPKNASEVSPHLLQILTDGGPTFLRAASANDTHFQGELMAGLRNWHAYAVSIAMHGGTPRGGNLFSALLVNSFADHFLEDFFAPGHIITPRFGMHDAVAMGMHNYYNAEGSDFRVNAERWHELADLEKYLSALPSSSCVEPLDSTVHGPLRIVRLWGDGNLRDAPNEELLITLVVARSIRDILESWATGKEVNHFKTVSWTPMYIENRRPVLATAGIPYGSHEPQDGPLVFPAIIGVSTGAEILSGSHSGTRSVTELDYLIFGLPPLRPESLEDALAGKRTSLVFTARSWGLSGGYSYSSGAGEIARGPKLRLIFAAALLHSQVSFDVARKRYLQNSRAETAMSYGLRFQTGFSLLNLDLGIAQDHTFGRNGLHNAIVFRTGVSLMGPVSSIPGISSWLRKHS